MHKLGGGQGQVESPEHYATLLAEGAMSHRVELIDKLQGGTELLGVDLWEGAVAAAMLALRLCHI